MKTVKDILNFAFNDKPNRGTVCGAYEVFEDGSFRIIYAGNISENNGYTKALLLRYGCTLDIPRPKLDQALEEYLASHEIKEYSIIEKYKSFKN